MRVAKDLDLLHRRRRKRRRLLWKMGHLNHQTVDSQRLLKGAMPANAIVIAISVHRGHRRQYLQSQDDIPSADVAGMDDVVHIGEQTEYGLGQFAVRI